MSASADAPWTEAVPAQGDTLRVPPHSLEAEQSVLGGLLLDASAWDRAADILLEGDFYRSEHRLIFAAIGQLAMAMKAVDVITVFERLRVTAPASADFGGLPYLNALAQSVPSASNIRRYAEIVRERATLRRLIAIADEQATAAFAPKGQTAGDLIARFSGELTGLQRQQLRSVPRVLGGLVVKQLDRYSALADGSVEPGIPTGFPGLDEMLSGGLRPGLYIVAARPSVGKSSFSQQIALTLAQAGHPVLFLSQEMAESELADRALANVAGVSLTGLLTGRIHDDEWGRIAAGSDRLNGIPFHVDDQPALRLAEIRAKARSIPGLAALVVDYLQLCSSDLKGENRNNQIEEISRGLKALSKELCIPVIALSQLSRKVEERASKRPNMGDLRDSGAIEQDADVVIFLWPVRESPESKRKVIGLGVDKNRAGSTGEQALEFYGPHQRWVESNADISPISRTTARTGGFD